LDDVALRRYAAAQARRPVDRRWRIADTGRPRQSDAPGHDLRIDVVPATAFRQQVAFVDQQFVGQRNGVARNAKLRRQDARRRQRDADRNVAIEDRGDEHFADLRLQSDLAAKREVDELIPHCQVSGIRYQESGIRMWWRYGQSLIRKLAHLRPAIWLLVPAGPWR